MDTGFYRKGSLSFHRYVIIRGPFHTKIPSYQHSNFRLSHSCKKQSDILAFFTLKRNAASQRSGVGWGTPGFNPPTPPPPTPTPPPPHPTPPHPPPHTHTHHTHTQPPHPLFPYFFSEIRKRLFDDITIADMELT